MKKTFGTLRRSGVSKVTSSDVIRPLDWFVGLKRLLDIFAKKIHETKMARGQPRPQRHLKILDKLKITTLYEKDADMLLYNLISMTFFGK